MCACGVHTIEMDCVDRRSRIPPCKESNQDEKCVQKHNSDMMT